LVLGFTFQFSKALSGTFRISPGSVLGKNNNEPYVLDVQAQVLRTVGYSLRSIELSWPMGIFWDLQRLGSRKGNFSTIGCTNHISSWRDTNIAHRWWTCDLFYANKHKISKKCVESHKI